MRYIHTHKEENLRGALRLNLKWLKWAMIVHLAFGMCVKIMRSNGYFNPHLVTVKLFTT